MITTCPVWSSSPRSLPRRRRVMFSTTGNHIRFIKLTRLFVLLYIFVCATIALHQQDRYLAEMRIRVVEIHATHQVALPCAMSWQRFSDQVTIAAERECPVCKFVADLIARVPTPQVPVRQPVLVTYYNVLWERPKPFLPYRFCDRSSSRAPPLS